MSNIPHWFHLRTLQSLWLIDRAAIGAVPRTHSPFLSPGRIASTHPTLAGRECGYKKMDIHGREDAAISASFRTIRLCTMGIFSSGLWLWWRWRYDPITSVHQMEGKLNVSRSLYKFPFSPFCEARKHNVAGAVRNEHVMAPQWEPAFFLTIQTPHFLNGSIGSLSIAAFSIITKSFGHFDCNSDQTENDSMSSERQDWKSQQEGYEMDEMEKNWWTWAMAGVRVKIRASDLLCLCSII